MKIYIECKSLKGHMGVVEAAVDEAINKVTNIEIELATQQVLSREDIDTLIGKPISLFVEDIVDKELCKVRFDGQVFYFSDIAGGADDNGIYYYSLVMNPTLWTLNYSVSSRSFTNKSRIQVVDEVLQSHGFVEGVSYEKSYFKESVYIVFNQLLQTGTSDLSFFQTLLANAGINYFFDGDKNGEKPEILRLIDTPAFFPTMDSEIPIVSSGGMTRQSTGNGAPIEKFYTNIVSSSSTRRKQSHVSGGAGKDEILESNPHLQKFEKTIVSRARHIESIVRTTRVAPTTIRATVTMSDGSVQSSVVSHKVDKSGTDEVVHLIVPEGNRDPETAAKQISAAASEGFAAERVTYRGVSDHIRIRPGHRIQVRNTQIDDTYKILVTSVYHMFKQSVSEALSEFGGWGVVYENHFTAAESLAPIRPKSGWSDVNERTAANTSMNIVPSSASVLKQIARRVPRATFNPTFEPEKNTDAINDLIAVVLMQQEHIKTLMSQVAALQSAVSANGSGLVAAEITKDAWVTEGYELVCMVKSAAFENPIVVKVAVTWHDRGGGMLNLPRKGNHVWIQQVHGSKGNDWVLVGYRPTAAVSSSNNPAKSFKIKALQ